MNLLFDNLANFQFIRLWPLFLIAPVLLVWWISRNHSNRSTGHEPREIAPHLAQALMVGQNRQRRFQPIDGVAVVLILLFVAAAGPTWSRIPNPLVSDTAPLAIALKVSSSMERTDLAPSRLERAKHKILDLLDRRAGARTALIAYAGTTHRVVPLTEDPAVVKPFLEGLAPAIMPTNGSNATAALKLARETLDTSDVRGSVLFVLDDFDSADLPAFRQYLEETGKEAVFLVAKPDGQPNSVLEQVPGATVVQLSPDASDLTVIERRIAAQFRDELNQDNRQAWDDKGWILAWPAAALMLFWFRRGWVLRLSLLLVLMSASAGSREARADGWKDWFLTPDQQGRLAYDAKEFAKAADLFDDPMWRGHALARAGKYEEAAKVYATLPSADAAFAEGVAHMRSRAYRDGVRAFEKALDRDPDYPDAAYNLELAKHIVIYIERVREQSDTGEEKGIGADDVVYDNEAAKGAETTREHGSGEVLPETADQWMRTVDTRTSDFLRSRFALEAARGSGD
ncbi:VWA domain-containing protein [Roseibium sediminis]|uniref:VWA domain-containing protein n=1 Tax=Roseibium sediminis TaxID=1775174 RepID=UPI00123DD837|nr:VWA domain-containing protein [Roseibium sediminis]